jgi:hypothetical protein
MALLAVLLPLVGPVVLAAMLWEYVDRGFQGGFVGSNRELSGFLMAKVVPNINQNVHCITKRFMRHDEDSFVVPQLLLQGIFIPVTFYLSFLRTKDQGFSLVYCFVYHVFRIGPYFMSFAYYYTLCHKEGHTHTGLFAKKFNNIFSRNIFNWWISLFFGVMPAAFAFGHSLNHHRYDNGPLDVVSTADKPRDSVVNFIAYLPRWALYSLNVSSIMQFTAEGNVGVSLKMIAGCAFWWTWFMWWAQSSMLFAVGYVLYPFAENVLLLAAINWSWHAFNCPDHPGDNEFVSSVTILDGPMNVLNEVWGFVMLSHAAKWKF